MVITCGEGGAGPTPLSAAALQYYHVIVLVFVGWGVVVLEVQEGDGTQLGGDTAGTAAAFWVDGVHKSLHHCVLGGAEMGRQWVETLPRALVCLEREEEGGRRKTKLS